MMHIVENVQTLYTLGPVLAHSGFATVYALPDHPTQLIRIQEAPNRTHVSSEIHLLQTMSNAGLTPLTHAQFVDQTHHALLSQRFEMDLEHWLDMTTPEVHQQSLWTLRVRQLLRGMAGLGIFCMDLKPANVVIDTEENTDCLSDMKLIDFGGGLCWAGYDAVERHALYAALLLVFNASIKHTRPNLYVGPGGPFGSCLYSLFVSAERRASVYQILTTPLVQYYWSNLFFSVPMVPYLAHFL